MDLEVKTILREIVKPSSPTPTHLKNFKLSLLDQIFPDFHIPTLLFYHQKTPCNLERIGRHLKSSLSQTLSQFYPLAGRFLDESTLSCNDEGIPFIETRVNSSLSMLLSLPSNRKWLTKLVPPQDVLLTTQVKPQLAFQINVFTCGGVVIGWYGSHKMFDAISIVKFFKHWAAINTACQSSHKFHLDMIRPNFDAAVNAFPPCQQGIPQVRIFDNNPNLHHDFHAVKVVGRTFVFSNTALNNLKANAASEKVLNPTRFETVSGFLWAHSLAAIEAALGAGSTQTRLSFPINLRERSNQPLPKGSIGNLTAQLVIQAEKKGGFLERVKDVHEGVKKNTYEVLAEYQKGEQAILAYREMLSREVFTPKYDPNLFMLTSWCKIGLDELDFGFGKPQWVSPTDEAMVSAQKNFIKLSDYIHPNGDDDASSHGIAAWVYLEEKAMQILESNADFIAFATPVW